MSAARAGMRRVLEQGRGPGYVLVQALLRVVVVVALVALVVAGAARLMSPPSPAGSSSTVAPAPSSSTTSPFVPDPREVLAGMAVERWPAVFGDDSSVDVVAAVMATCAALEAGATGDEVFARMAAETATVEEARAFGWLAGTGVRMFCPQYGAALQAGGLS